MRYFKKFVLFLIIIILAGKFSYSFTLPSPDKPLTAQDVKIIFSTLKLDVRDVLNKPSKINRPIFTEIYDKFFKENTQKIKSSYFVFNTKLQGFTKTIYKLLYHKVKPSVLNTVLAFSFTSLTYLISSLTRQLFKLKILFFSILLLLLTFQIVVLSNSITLHDLLNRYFIKRE